MIGSTTIRLPNPLDVDVMLQQAGGQHTEGDKRETVLFTHRVWQQVLAAGGNLPAITGTYGG